MKKTHNLKLFGILIVAVIISSCAKNILTMSVTEPAPVTIPSAIKKIGIINRSMPSSENEKIDKLDKILTIEGKNLDKDGSSIAIQGLFNELGKNERFTEIKILDSLLVNNPGLGIFPAPLSWETTQKICQDNGVDAIFCLSFYDTDAKIDYRAENIEIAGPLGTKIPAIEHHATISTLIKTGWRIYDPNNKILLDEFVAYENVVSSGKGINPLKAAEAIIGRKEAVIQASNGIGYNYALRIIPYRIRVSREYYVRGTENFKIAKRRAQTGNWDGAAELWYKEVPNPKRKIAGRACYNAAIINEINGDLDKAVEWASKSYTDYKNKPALDYLNILNNRIYRNNQLKKQMEQ
ncbi:MAG: DUF6340 family protein [Bacteroidota bacterium]